MILGLSWQIEAMAYFNVMQLIILIYGLAVLVIRLANILNVNWWKLDTIMSVMLACLEFAATSIYAYIYNSLSGVPIPASVLNTDALVAMVVSIYIK